MSTLLARSMSYQPLQRNFYASKSAVYTSSTVCNFPSPLSTRWSKLWLRLAKINLVIPPGITQTLIWFSQRGITLTNTWTMRQIFIDRATSHRRFLQLTYRRNYHSVRVRPSSKSVARIQHRKHAAIPRPRRTSASRCLWIFSANVQLGLRTPPRSYLYSIRMHIRRISQIYPTGIGPLYR